MFKFKDNEPKERFTLLSIWQFIYPVLMYYAIQVVVVVIIEAWALSKDPELVDMALNNSTEFSSYFLKEFGMTTMMCTNIITIPILILFMYLDKKRISKMGYKRELGKINYSLYLLIPVISILFLFAGNDFTQILIGYLPKSFLDTYAKAANQIYNADDFTLIFTTVIIGPLCEELLFRGMVYKRVKRVSNIALATVISGIVFGVAHANWVQGIYTFLFNIILVFVYEKYKTIIAPIIAHVSANGISVLFTYLTDGLEEAAEGIEVVKLTPQNFIELVALMAVTIVVTYIINSLVNREEKYILVDSGNASVTEQVYDMNYYGDINADEIRKDDEGFNG